MKAKEFITKWNFEHPDMHFYIEESADGVTGVKIRFRATCYNLSGLQWRQLETVVSSRSRQTMSVISGATNCRSGAIDIVANPLGADDFENIVIETLEHLGNNVFPEFAKRH